MNKKFTSLFASLALFSTAAIASGNYTYDILGTTYKVDTLYHAKVGPGTTQTSLLFTGPTYNLRVFYLTVDIKTPNVSIRAVSGNDMVAGCETTSSMAKRHDAPGERYFCGVNGDFYATGGTTLRGKSVVGTPTNASIVDGEIFKTSEAWKQFAIDVDGVPHVGFASFSQGTAECGGKTVAFKGVNVSSPNNALTVYTPKYYGGTNMQTSNMSEVTVKLLEGEKFQAGRSCKVVVTGTPSSAGDMDIPDDGLVLHGRGSVSSFVSELKAGDVVTLNSVVTIDGKKIVPQQLVSGNPKTVGGGETLDTEAERGDASGYHPRTGIGYNADGTKVIMMVVDGRSAISNGARTSQVGEIMRYAGAAEAINLDGGGSSTCYTQALGIRNVPSDGNERSDGNAIFAVCSAPDDNEIAEIRFVDWAMQFPKYGIYTPKLYGYNKYGMLIDTDLKGAKLSCPKELGYVKEDGTTFVGDGNGTYALTATYNGITATIPVTIVPSTEVKMAHESVINDGFRNYPVEVLSKVNEDFLLLDPAALTWSSDDASVVEIDAQTGVLKGVKNGTATIHGKVDDFDGAMQVVVEKPTARAMAIEPGIDSSTWTITQVGGSNGKMEASGDGFRYVYTGKSGRSPYIKLAKAITLWSLPDTLRLRMNPGEAKVNAVTFSLETANGLKENVKLTPTFEAGKYTNVDVPMDTWCDPSNIAVYPIKLNYIYFTMGSSSAGQEYVLDCPGFENVYASFVASGGVNQVSADKGFGLVKTSLVQGEPLTLHFDKAGAASVLVYNAAGQKVEAATVQAEAGVAQVAASSLSQGIYFVSITQNGENSVERIIVK